MKQIRASANCYKIISFHIKMKTNIVTSSFPNGTDALIPNGSTYKPTNQSMKYLQKYMK